jgi:7-cyano-7-deazaguanine synthase
MNKVLAVVSGGMDSVTLAHMLKADGHAIELLSVNYGQRHVRELRAAERCAERLDSPHLVLDLPLGPVLTGSALTDPDVEVPEGHYADESMRSTVVPNRNAILLSVAVGVAIAHGLDGVAVGVHAGDHPIYPDCRPQFIDAFARMIHVANEGFIHPTFEVLAPFIRSTKDEIVTIGAKLGVPYEDTWSCYKGGEVHCGRCGTCVERREAFVLAGVHDPTRYETDV